MTTMKRAAFPIFCRLCALRWVQDIRPLHRGSGAIPSMPLQSSLTLSLTCQACRLGPFLALVSSGELPQSPALVLVNCLPLYSYSCPVRLKVPFLRDWLGLIRSMVNYFPRILPVQSGPTGVLSAAPPRTLSVPTTVDLWQADADLLLDCIRQLSAQHLNKTMDQLVNLVTSVCRGVILLLQLELHSRQLPQSSNQQILLVQYGVQHQLYVISLTDHCSR